VGIIIIVIGYKIQMY